MKTEKATKKPAPATAPLAGGVSKKRSPKKSQSTAIVDRVVKEEEHTEEEEMQNFFDTEMTYYEFGAATQA